NPGRQAHRELPVLCDLAHHVPRSPLPGLHRADPADRLRADRSGPELPIRGNQYPHYGGRGSDHGETDERPTGTTQLRRAAAMTRMLIVGPPGAGKGTQAQRISDDLNIVAISTGDIFRENIKGETELGKEAKKYVDAGELVPDSVTNRMVEDRLTWEDAAEGFLLDGYPRNLSQVAAF